MGSSDNEDPRCADVAENARNEFDNQMDDLPSKLRREMRLIIYSALHYAIGRTSETKYFEYEAE